MGESCGAVRSAAVGGCVFFAAERMCSGRRGGRLRAPSTVEISMLEIGAQAPDFSVRDHAGATHTLADYRGRHLVLWFYPKADTPG